MIWSSNQNQSCLGQGFWSYKLDPTRSPKCSLFVTTVWYLPALFHLKDYLNCSLKSSAQRPRWFPWIRISEPYDFSIIWHSQFLCISGHNQLMCSWLAMATNPFIFLVSYISPRLQSFHRLLVTWRARYLCTIGSSLRSSNGAIEVDNIVSEAHRT